MGSPRGRYATIGGMLDRVSRLIPIVVMSSIAWLLPASAAAQPGATGPIAELNAEAKATTDSDPDRSLAAALKAQAAAHRAGDVRGEAEALNYIALAHRGQSLLDLSLREAQESARLYRGAGDRWGEAQGYNTVGLIEADAGRFANALENHLKAQAIREANGDKEGLAYTFNNLGNVYRSMGDFRKALEHHERGLQLKIALGLRSSEAFSHHNIGLVYFAMKDYPGALAAYRRGLGIREQLNDPRGIAVSLNAIGSVEAITDPSAALATYQRALALRRQTGDRRGEMATELNVADLHRRSGRLDQAAATLERAMALGLEAPLMRANALKGLAEVAAARGDYARAYRHQLDYQKTYDEIFSQQNAQRFHHLEAAQEAERAGQRMRLLEQENALRDLEIVSVRNSRMALGIIAGLVFVSLALLYARFRNKQQSESRLRAQAEELFDALARVKTLRGMLPICAWCKKIRDDKGYWTQVETYISGHSAAEFTHCICPTCVPRVAGEPPKAQQA
jgi:tetratricopeptide (TPR) repeat protein